MKHYKNICEEIVDLGNSLGIPRKDMPQIDGKHLQEFISYVRENGVEVESREMLVSDLKPSQSELDTDKADKIWNEGNAHEYPIYVSKDGYVLDGHHRWLALQRNDEGGKIRCQVICKPAEESLELMHDFDKSKKIDIEDNIVEGIHYSTKIKQIDEAAGVRRIRSGLKTYRRMLENLLDEDHPTPSPEGPQDKLLLEQCRDAVGFISENLRRVKTRKKKK